MKDVQTLDCLTLLQFKDYFAKERWISLVQFEFFKNSDMEITMNFARRWGKVMQYLINKENRNLEDIAVISACEANADGVVTQLHADHALSLLTDLWIYGESLQRWADNGGRTSIVDLF